MSEKCKFLFESLPLACLLLKPEENDFVIKDLNEAYIKLVAKEKSLLIGASVGSLFECRPVQKETIEASLTQCFTTGEIIMFKYSNYDSFKSGEESFWEVLNIPIKSKSEERIDYILHLPWNKTKEVLEENRREQLQNKLNHKILENECFISKSRDGLFSLDRQGKFVNVNEGLANMANLPAQQLLKMSFLPFCAPYHHEKIYQYFLKALEGEDQNLESDFICNEGRTLHLDISLLPMKIDSKIIGVYGVARDITERKLAEKIIQKQRNQLAGSEKKFKALIQKSTDLIAVLNAEGEYKFVSDSTLSILGFPPEEFIGKNAFDFIHPEDREAVKASFAQVQNENQVEIPSFRFKDAKGNWKWLETTVTNQQDDPFVQGIVTNSRDVTVSRNLWRETERQNKILKQIAWEHAHILRAPVVKIKALFNYLEDKSYGEWTEEKIQNLIKNSVEDLDRIILKTVKKTENIELKRK